MGHLRTTSSWPWLGSAVLVVLAFAHRLLPDTAHALWTAVVIVLGISSVRLGISRRSDPGSGWSTFSAGLTWYALGDLVAVVATAALGPDHVVATISWAVGLLGIPVLVNGVRRGLSTGRADTDVEGLLDAAIVSLSVGYVGWYLVVAPMVSRDGWGSYGVIGGSLLWVASISVLGIILGRGLGSGGGTTSLWLFASAVPLAGGSSVVYWTLEQDHAWESAPVARVLMALAYAACAAAFAHPSARDILGRRARPRPWVPLIVVASGLTLLPVLQIGTAVGLVELPRTDVIGGSIGLLVTAVAIVRLALTLHLRQRAQTALAAREARFRSLVEHAYEGVITLDREMRVTWGTHNSADVTGVHASDLVGNGALGEIHPDDHDAFTRHFVDCLSAAGRRVRGRCRLLAVTGEHRHIDFTLVNQLDNPAVDGVVINYRDVTDHITAQVDLAHQASHDTLTGLPNRAHLMASLERATSEPDAEPMAVLFLDLDRFKVINDSLGHEIGDRLLVSAARRIAGAVEGTHLVARHGGDEFVVVCPGMASAVDAMRLASGICRSLATPVSIDGHELSTSASIGVTIRLAGETPNDLLRDADTAMYQAKARGRDGFVLFDASSRKAAEVRQQLETGLRRALSQGDLTLHYQPVVGLDTGRIEGVEALIRWADHVVACGPVGTASPAEMIQVAEESGLIIAIGTWVLDRACADLAALDTAQPGLELSVAVNVSGDQLRRTGFADVVLATLARHGLGPDRLVLELTESVVVEDAPIARQCLEALRAAGVRMAMDDFGTGYSALSNLKRIPIAQVKIDRSFVDGLVHDRDDGAIVRAVVGMAHALGLVVVAEGVETQEQQQILTDIGCDLVQGYHLGRPMDRSALEAVLAKASPAEAIHAGSVRSGG